MPAAAPDSPHPDRLTAARPALFGAAALLSLVSLGMSWGSVHLAAGRHPVNLHLLGVQHPVRALLPLAALLIWWGLRQGARGPAWAGLALGALALPLQPVGRTLPPGRLLYGLAVLLAAAALAAGASRRGTGQNSE
jgi:hypothetical protein